MVMFKDTDSSDVPEENGQLNGGPEDLKMANELSTSGRWSEALDVINNILALPDDANPALDRLQAVLADSAPVATDVSFDGKTESGEQLGSVKIRLSGGVLPDLMAMRGQCIWQSIITVMKCHNDDFRAVLADTEFEHLYALGTMHSYLVSILLTEHTEAMYYAGMVCLCCQQPAPAARIFQHVLQLNPQHEQATEALPIAMNAAQAMGETV